MTSEVSVCRCSAMVSVIMATPGCVISSSLDPSQEIWGDRKSDVTTKQRYMSWQTCQCFSATIKGIRCLQWQLVSSSCYDQLHCSQSQAMENPTHSRNDNSCKEHKTHKQLSIKASPYCYCPFASSLAVRFKTSTINPFQEYSSFNKDTRIHRDFFSPIKISSNIVK